MAMLFRTLGALLLGAALAVPAARADDDAARIFDMPYQMTTLENGLRVIIVPTAAPGVVTLQIPARPASPTSSST